MSCKKVGDLWPSENKMTLLITLYTSITHYVGSTIQLHLQPLHRILFLSEVFTYSVNITEVLCITFNINYLSLLSQSLSCSAVLLLCLTMLVRLNIRRHKSMNFNLIFISVKFFMKLLPIVLYWEGGGGDSFPTPIIAFRINPWKIFQTPFKLLT